MNGEYCKNDRDREITLDDVMRFQKHMSLESHDFGHIHLIDKI